MNVECGVTVNGGDERHCLLTMSGCKYLDCLDSAQIRFGRFCRRLPVITLVASYYYSLDQDTQIRILAST